MGQPPLGKQLNENYHWEQNYDIGGNKEKVRDRAPT